MSLVRQPPPRPFENVRRDGRRVCPLCGELSTSKRGWWHQECAEMWRYVAFPQSAIALLVKAHGRICWGCRARDRELELEHIRPLWSLTAAERLELKWWLPFNLQLLCRDCHRAKTAREARERYDAQNPDSPSVLRRGTGSWPTLPGLLEATR